MNLEDYRSAYYEASGQASEIGRKLGFAGIALIWLFKKETSSGYVVPEPLMVPAALIILALALDFLQYVAASAIWASFSRWNEMKRVAEAEPLTAPRYFNYPMLLLFWSKIPAICIAYVFLLSYTLSQLA